MIPLMNAVACLLALAMAQFFWRRPIRLFKEAFFLLAAVVVFCVYAYFSGDMNDPAMESYPFRMFALALCFSTTALPVKRLLAIAVSVFGSTFLSRISQGMEFALMAYWIAVWVFF